MKTLLPFGLVATGLLAAAAATAADKAAAATALRPSTSIPEGDIVDVAADAGSFGTLLAAAEAAGLVDALRGEGPLTVLAPTDEAFAKLGDEAIASLLKPENKEQLQGILLYHVIAGGVTAQGALTAQSAETLAKKSVTFRLDGGRLKVNGDVNVVANDVEASNGIIHVIDTVLLPQPDAPAGRLVIGFFSDNPGEELANYLGLDSSTCLLIERVTKGSEAATAGLRAWDLVVAVNGEPATKEIIARAKRNAGAGGVIELDVLRRGTPMKINTRVGAERH